MVIVHTRPRGEIVLFNILIPVPRRWWSNVTYHLGKLRDLGLLKGEWLDCGCADGGYTVTMVDLGAERAVGVDALEERIVQARERVHPAVEFRQKHAETLPFTAASFDGVLLNEVLEHVLAARTAGHGLQ